MKKLWFKAKKYGYGWYPVTWEGWLTIAIYVLLLIGTGSFFPQYIERQPFVYFGWVILLTAVLIYVSYKTGEKARWRWGEDKLRQVSLVFLVKKENNQITDVCLAMKKRGFGVNRWNGVGGKMDLGETIEETAIRETQEEICVDLTEIEKVAVIDFYFPHNPGFNQQVHAYLAESWEGNPIETEEMRPQWFKVADIPYQEMWSDDEFWLPQVLAGQKVRAKFTFSEQEAPVEQDVKIVDSF
ncbi:MAG TPA: 8-oxo-dGTP diphosphatase [bacterium]|nr:8-oxo-dGTP diphosphatase [bacterium]